ncbi:MAG: hypothetical protein KDD46_07060 [Bdellovibrionales bacterium]|nr:hypothetical protein [Bdellovibrionales bacterium]
MVTGSGGHAKQCLLLLDQIKHRANFHVMLEKNDPLSAKTFANYPLHYTIAFRGKKEFFLITFFRILMCTLQSFIVFIKVHPDCILSTGPGIAIPISYIAKIFGKKVIFIESWSRVHTKSLSGKLLYPIANAFFIQWPSLITQYPRALDAGRLDAFFKGAQ